MSYLLWSPQVELMKNQLCEVRLEYTLDIRLH